MPEVATYGSAVPGTVVSSGSLVTPGGDPGVAGEAQEVGSIKAWPAVAAPASWMLCDGSAISRSLYSALFAVIGTTYGAGDGSTTFALPDLRGRFLLGTGLGGGLTNRALAATGGEEAHQLTTAELASHAHIQNPHSHTFGYTGPVAYAAGGGSIYTLVLGGSNTSTTNTTATNQNTGGDGAHNTMPPFLVVTYIIKVSPSGGPTAQAPLADSTQDGLLRKVSGLATDFVDGTNNCQNLVTAIQPTIWSMRLRSFNALESNNPNFEIDQRNVGGTFPNPPSGTLIIDRWGESKVGTMVCSFGQNSAAANEVLLPGAGNFAITSKFFRVTLTTAQASLGASDRLTVWTQPEGPMFRELQYVDAHSLSLLVRSSVAGLKFGVSIRDSPSTKSLTKLCGPISSANTWQLIQLSNLPVFPAGNFTVASGSIGYWIAVTLAAGSTRTSPANDTFQNGDFDGALGQDSFVSKATGSTFDLAFVQHEPGNQSSTLMDLPFDQNLWACQRFYTKSYPYGTGPGSITGAGNTLFVNPTSSTQLFCTMYLKRTMARVPPTVTFYSTATGTANTIRNLTSAADVSAGAGGISPGDSSIGGVNVTTGPAAGSALSWHYVADTGW
jgi:microcystin-dependent protein